MAETTGTSRSGFHGAGPSVPLVDMLQLWSMNRFSGLIAVTWQSETGHLYFSDGEIVHAEASGLTGEEAVHVILTWPDGSFDSYANTGTLKRTIQKKVSHLLLDAHRIIDEQRKAAPPMTTPPPMPPRPQPAAGNLLDQVRAIPDVIGLARFGSDGRPSSDQGPEAEVLAARGLYLAMTHAAAVAAAFGLRDLATASLRGAQESFVVVHARGNYLCVAVRPGAAVEPVEARVRALLTKPAAR
jgi:hypothetical protein